MPAAVEVTLGSLEVQPIALHGASAWFKRQVLSHQRGQQYREVSLLAFVFVVVVVVVVVGCFHFPRYVPVEVLLERVPRRAVIWR